MGANAKTDWPTERRLWYNFDFDKLIDRNENYKTEVVYVRGDTVDDCKKEWSILLQRNEQILLKLAKPSETKVKGKVAWVEPQMDDQLLRHIWL
jgi:hypothetical protein